MASDDRGGRRDERPLVFDVGFHCGEDTAFYLRLGYRVAAFEAIPGLAEAGRRRFAAEIEAGDLTLFEGAVRGIDAGDTQRFWVNRRHSDWGTAMAPWRDRNEKAFAARSDAIDVPVIRLQAVIAQVGVPLYAKIDVEGLDHEILATFADFAERPRFVSVESAKDSFDALLAEIAQLKALGYRRFKAVQQRTIPGAHRRVTALGGQPIIYRFDRFSSGPFGDDLDGWRDEAGVIGDYRRIFRDYARFGDESWLQRRMGRAPIALLQTLARRPLPGWYDTHARLD